MADLRFLSLFLVAGMFLVIKLAIDFIWSVWKKKQQSEAKSEYNSGQQQQLPLTEGTTTHGMKKWEEDIHAYRMHLMRSSMLKAPAAFDCGITITEIFDDPEEASGVSVFSPFRTNVAAGAANNAKEIIALDENGATSSQATATSQRVLSADVERASSYDRPVHELLAITWTEDETDNSSSFSSPAHESLAIAATARRAREDEGAAATVPSEDDGERISTSVSEAFKKRLAYLFIRLDTPYAGRGEENLPI